MYYYSTDDLRKLQKKIVNVGLIAPTSIVSCKAQKLQPIGVDWMSKTSRKIITKALYYAEATACIHDYEYHYSDGEEERRKAVDEIFLINGLREVRARYPQWWNIRRWFGERAVLMAHEVLSRTGALAWQSAFAKRIQREFKQRKIKAKEFFKHDKID